MTDKSSLRSILQAARTAQTDLQREQDRAAIRAQVLAECASGRVAAGGRIAAYEPLRTEPGSLELLAELDGAGYQLIVPFTLPDRDLDWTVWRPGDADRPLLGVAAITTAALVLVPALAVDAAGHRLGRGGGSYDRALARLPGGTPVAALLYQDELLPAVPVDPWDQAVTAVITPAGWSDLGTDRLPVG